MTKKEIVNNIKKMDNEKIINLWNECVEEQWISIHKNK